MGKIAEWVQSEVAAKDEADDVGLAERRVTCRINGGKFFMLHKVSEVLGMSKTACAEKLLEEAIQEAWDTLNLGDPGLAEMRRFLSGAMETPSMQEQIVQALRQAQEEAQQGKIKSAAIISSNGSGDGGYFARVQSDEDNAALAQLLELLKEDLLLKK